MEKTGYVSKYVKYLIQVIYLNDEKEILHSYDVENTTYKNMVKLYKEAKEKFKDECVTVQFIGIDAENNEGILFQKQFITEDLTIKEHAQKLNYQSFELIQQVIDAIDTLSQKRSKISAELCIADKEQDRILHEIEGSKGITITEKATIFDKLQEARDNRRHIKDEKMILDRYFDMMAENKIILNFFKSKSTDFIGVTQKSIKKVKDHIVPLTEKKAEELEVIKEISYRNFKDRINLMKELQKKYDKVYHDDAKMKIIAYSKSKC